MRKSIEIKDSASQVSDLLFREKDELMNNVLPYNNQNDIEIKHDDLDFIDSTNQVGNLLFREKGKLMNGIESSNSNYFIRIKRSNLDFIEHKQYCGLYKQSEKGGEFVLDGTFDPIILPESTKNKEKEKNFFCAMCSDNENIFGLRFCFANEKLEAKEVKDELLDNTDLVWLELRQDKEGNKFLARYNPQNKNWEDTDISFALKDLFGGNDIQQSGKNTIWEIYPKEKYVNGKYLTTFATQDCIVIKTNDDPNNPLKEMKEMVENDTGLSIDGGEMNIYTCMQFTPEGEFYLDWGPKDATAKAAFNGGLGTLNNHNGKMEDVFALRFYVTPEKLDINVGNKFDETKILNPKECSVFEVRKDENNNMVMWHFDRNNNTWLPVDATIVHKVEYEEVLRQVNIGFRTYTTTDTEHKDIHEYKCKLHFNSYSVESLWKYGSKYEFTDKKTDTCNLSFSTLKLIQLRSGSLKRWFGRNKSKIIFSVKRWFGRNKSKIIFSVSVGFLNTILFGLFAIPSAVILFLSLFFMDKFLKIPSVEKWFEIDKRRDNYQQNIQIQYVSRQRNISQQQNWDNYQRQIERILLLMILSRTEDGRRENFDMVIPNDFRINNRDYF